MAVLTPHLDADPADTVRPHGPLQPITLRDLSSEDMPAFRALRLEAIRRHPEAFLPSYEEERAVDPPSAARARARWLDPE